MVRDSDSGFRWNEFELMGLEALADDKESCDMIRLFWDSHIPILMSVKDGYQYLCIDLSPENYGKIYYGVEPEFEDSAEFVCDSFNHLLEIHQPTLIKILRRTSLSMWWVMCMANRQLSAQHYQG